MLKKCFKYDFKSIIKIWWISAVTILALSVAAGFALKNLTLHASDPNRTFILETTVIVIYYLSIFIISIFSSVLLGIRFYSNFYSDEGYLTFTLPVKRTTLFLSKVLTGLAFQLLSVASIFVSLIIIALIVPAYDDVHFSALGSIIADIITFIGDIPKNELIWFVVYVAEICLLGFLFVLSGVLLLYMLITLGSTAVKKFKAAATVGFLVGANYVLSALLVPSFLAFGLWFSAAMHLYEETMNGTAGFTFVALILFFGCILFATASALFFNITQGCLERKLNLA